MYTNPPARMRTENGTAMHDTPTTSEPLRQDAGHADARRRVLVQLEALRDGERRRIARELHDGLGQQLVSVQLAVQALRPWLADAEGRARFEALQGLVQRLDRELDRIVFALRPAALEGCGLAEGVRAYLQSWSGLTGVAADLELFGLDAAQLPAPAEAAVFRVLQEALTNVAKHAQASRVSVSLARQHRELCGSVEDDGRGFLVAAGATPAAGRSHWGLTGMRERVEALGGHFSVESQPGRGTAVLWRVPVG